MSPDTLFSCRIVGDPVRAKHACVCRGKHASTRPDPVWAAWRKTVSDGIRSAWLPRPPYPGPVIVEFDAFFRPPVKPRRTYTVKGTAYPYPPPGPDGRLVYIGTPDWDNVGKASADVLVHGGMLADDPLVVDARLRRFYAADIEGSGGPRCEMRVIPYQPEVHDALLLLLA